MIISKYVELLNETGMKMENGKTIIFTAQKMKFFMKAFFNKCGHIY